MTISHIDHNFFRLTAQQAKALSIENRLPREGCEIKADPAKLADVVLDYGSSRGRAAFGWIKRTRLSWHRGEPVLKGWTWAIHVMQ